MRLFYERGRLEAGCDEAGRGCLAGPVVAAAVIMPESYYHPLIRDSKTLSAEERDKVRRVILRKALSYGIGVISSQRIDMINILNASFEAMHRAVDQLHLRPEMLLIDGNRFNPYSNLPFECVIKGDNKFISIAAASILAKTTRDALMQQLHHRHPEFGWNSNKGYPTPFHRNILYERGPSFYHRRSFRLEPLPEQMELF